jgi:hypothetical protein
MIPVPVPYFNSNKKITATHPFSFINNKNNEILAYVPTNTEVKIKDPIQHLFSATRSRSILSNKLDSDLGTEISYTSICKMFSHSGFFCHLSYTKIIHLHQCWGSGSGIRCFFDPLMRIWRFFPHPGSRIPNPYRTSASLVTIFGLKYIVKILCKIGSHVFLYRTVTLKTQKNKIIFICVKFIVTKKGKTKNISSPSSFVVVVLHPVNPGLKKTGAGKNIPDPQHCALH